MGPANLPITPFLGHAANTAGTLILTIIMLKTDILGIQQHELSNAYARIGHLELMQDTLHDKLLVQEGEIASLRIMNINCHK